MINNEDNDRGNTAAKGSNRKKEEGGQQ